jgi:hypothetical protein
MSELRQRIEEIKELLRKELELADAVLKNMSELYVLMLRHSELMEELTLEALVATAAGAERRPVVIEKPIVIDKGVVEGLKKEAEKREGSLASMVLSVMEPGKMYTPTEILELIRERYGIKTTLASLYVILRRLVKRGLLRRMRRGIYQRAQ